jgi:tetratricopeptide (TPR) repeat protein
MAHLKFLAEGRKLSKEKQYKQAIAEFDKALLTAPNDARVLAEIGYAALLDKDLARSEAASEKALISSSDPKLRAQVLYNLGRVAEAREDKALAAKHYKQSLQLRENGEVSKRLAALGGTATEAPSACDQAFPSIEALCSCQIKREDLLIASSPKRCQPLKLDFAEKRLSVIEVSAETVGVEASKLLVAKDADGFRVVAEVGSTYVPGAFGVNNESTVKSATGKKLKQFTVVEVIHVQENHDSNLAGLEVCHEAYEVHTLCVLDEKAPTRCVLAIPVESSVGCGPGAEPDPKESDAAILAMAKSAKDGAYKHEAKTSFSWDENGELTVKLESGDATMLPKSLLGKHALLAP